MSDIVEQLKGWASLVSSGYEVPTAGSAMVEAADEITRLRAEVERLQARVAELEQNVEDLSDFIKFKLSDQKSRSWDEIKAELGLKGGA